MKKTMKSMVAILLAICMLMSATVVVFAAPKEVYLSDLRIVYADSYDEAVQNLTGSKLVGYQILNENLNFGTDKTGVWLAYKTTTNIDDAITDIAVMQMGGGYNEGNYQQMIQKSKNEYVAMGQIYLQAIDYFAEAYEAGNFLASSAYRQLNVYAGVDVYTDDRLGDLFLDGVLTENDLATLFMQGNSYVLDNVRSLLAMGVSYNEEGLSYLQRVSLLASGTYSGHLDESVANVTADDINVSNSEDVNVLAALIAPSLTTFRNMFEELSAYEEELNYEDEEYTELELRYAEYKAIAEMMRAVDYLDGQSLYDFCMNYSVNTNDYSKLYPLVNALNEGQIAMTKVMHYYDVVRYSMSDAPESVITEQLDELEAEFAEKPFDVYTGVDRDMYKGTFALTSAAYRADAYTDTVSLGEALFGNGAWLATSAKIAAGVAGAGLFTWAIVRTVKGNSAALEESTRISIDLSDDYIKKEAVKLAEKASNVYPSMKNEEVLNYIHKKVLEKGSSSYTHFQFKALSYEDKIDTLLLEMQEIEEHITDPKFMDHVKNLQEEYLDATKNVVKSGKSEATVATTSNLSSRLFTGALYIVGALSMAYSAVSLYHTIHDYYHPTYDVIPEAMVDLIKTEDGDRYIKYDVVTEITMKDGAYPAGDLNAFSAQRWNALYYTKSYEAGKPLLASFSLSNSNNRAADGYLPIHRFGEIVCYDLNKYNFKNTSYITYLSVEQSENEKSAVADIPNIIGSLFGNGLVFVVGGLSLAVGIGGTVGLKAILNKKKKGSNGDEATA